MGSIILIILILFLIGGLPTWPHSKKWGYLPTGIIGTIIIVYLVLIFIGYVPISF